MTRSNTVTGGTQVTRLHEHTPWYRQLSEWLDGYMETCNQLVRVTLALETRK